MAQYQKKMIQIDAFQYKGDAYPAPADNALDETRDVPAWAVEAFSKGILFYGSTSEGEPPRELFTRYPDGEAVHIPVGYYIIRWSDTELYPCEPNLFEASYRPAIDDLKAKIYGIATRYGYDAQSRMLIEEMAELTQAINKYWRKSLQSGKIPFSPSLREQRYMVVSEIADVQIMLWQIEYLMMIEDEELEANIRQKVCRQMQRIADEKPTSGESGGDVG